MLFAGRDTPLVTARLVNPAEATSISAEPDARVKDKRPAPVRLPPVIESVPSVIEPPLRISDTVKESDTDALVNPILPIPVQLPPVKVAVPSVSVPPLMISVAVRESDNDARTPVRLPVMFVVPNVAEVICP